MWRGGGGGGVGGRGERRGNECPRSLLTRDKI